MGVKHLWDIIDETKTKETLDYMRGKIVSVDLSIWIVEAMKTLQFKTSILKPHLRNMFYRILALRKLGIKLIFVTEGEPPDLKQNTMKKRNKTRYGAKSKTKTRVGRSRFQTTIKECCRLLDLLGMPHVKAAGEAEEMCAALNQYGHSDGCLTNDGDFLLYGGQTIYRDFGIDPKDPHIFVYDMEKIKNRLDISRNDMIGIALLTGCDYTEGVAGVGKGLIKNLLNERCYNEDFLSRFKKWCIEDCPIAEQMSKSETMIARKALKMENFLNQQIIDEYQISKDKLNDINEKLKWGYPDIKGLQEFIFAKMEWPFEYTLSKVMQLASSTYFEKLADNIFYPIPITPTHIVKTRCQHGVSLVEINWEKDVSQVYSVDTKWDNCPDVFTTLENHEFVLKLEPGLVETYIQLRENKKGGKGKKKEGKSKRGEKNEEEVKENLFSEETVDVHNKLKINKKKVSECSSQPAPSQLDCSSSQDYLCQGFANVAKVGKGDFLTDVLCEDMEGISLHDVQEVDEDQDIVEKENSDSDSENILPLFQRLRVSDSKENRKDKNNGNTSVRNIAKLNSIPCMQTKDKSVRKKTSYPCIPQEPSVANNSNDVIDLLTTSVLDTLGNETFHEENKVHILEHPNDVLPKEYIDRLSNLKEHVDRPAKLNSPSQKAKLKVNTLDDVILKYNTPKGLKQGSSVTNLIVNTPICFHTETPTFDNNTPGLMNSNCPSTPLVASTPLVKEFPVLQDITNFSYLGDSIILGHSMDLFDTSDALDRTPRVNNSNFNNKCSEVLPNCGESRSGGFGDLIEPNKSVKQLSTFSGFGDSILCDSLDLANISCKPVNKDEKEFSNVSDVMVPPSENYEDFLRKKFQISMDCDESVENVSKCTNTSLNDDMNCSIAIEGSPLSLTDRLRKGTRRSERLREVLEDESNVC